MPKSITLARRYLNNFGENAIVLIAMVEPRA